MTLPPTAKLVIWHAVALLLAGAAVLKIHQAVTVPSFGGSTQRFGTAGLIFFQITLALWMISRYRPAWSWRTAVLTFVVFAGYAAWSVHRNAADCGCFGVVRVDPRITLLLDLLVVTLLVAAGPAAPAVWVPRSGRVALAGTACFAFAGPLVALTAAPTYLRPDDDFDLGPAGGLVLLEPETWTGRPFPLLRHIPGRPDLSRGEWTLVFFRHDCGDCKRAVPKYLEEADRTGRLLLVETAPAAAGQIVPGHARDAVVSLSGDYQWLMQVPARVELRQGIVTTVR